MQQLDLCSGVGAGFCYAGLQLGFNLIGTAEIDPYCSGILANRYPGIHNYGDVQNLAYSGEIDLISASPPCPPFSTEGQRLGADDERDCFPAVIKIIRELQPKFIAIENVTGLLTCPYRPNTNHLYFSYILRQLALCGYDAEWLTIGSGHFASPFIRERVLLVAIARSLKPQWERATPWTDQARSRTEEVRFNKQRRGIKPGYPLSVVRNPGLLARPLGVPSRDGIIRRMRQAAGNLLDPRVAAIALNRIVYLNSLCREPAASYQG
ncbi:DNA cytosine methyltransferase [Nostoc sp. CHAB 5834]|nr:DNA cytosine methyltransferase [Nostoc sp. CHAB 5834]